MAANNPYGAGGGRRNHNHGAPPAQPPQAPSGYPQPQPGLGPGGGAPPHQPQGPVHPAFANQPPAAQHPPPQGQPQGAWPPAQPSGYPPQQFQQPQQPPHGYPPSGNAPPVVQQGPPQGGYPPQFPPAGAPQYGAGPHHDPMQPVAQPQPAGGHGQPAGGAPLHAVGGGGGRRHGGGGNVPWGAAAAAGGAGGQPPPHQPPGPPPHGYGGGGAADGPGSPARRQMQPVVKGINIPPMGFMNDPDAYAIAMRLQYEGQQLIKRMEGGQDIPQPDLEKFLKEYDAHIDTAFDTNAYPTATLLFLAARFNCFATVKALIAMGSNPNTLHPETNNQTPLFPACYFGYLDIVTFLVREGGCNPQLDSSHGKKCYEHFDSTVSDDTQTKIQHLICGTIAGGSAAAAITEQEEIMALRLAEYPISANLAEMQSLLDKHPALLNRLLPVPGTDITTTLLYTMARAVDPNSGIEIGEAGVRMLLARPGCDVNIQQQNGSTALHVACYRGHLRCVEALMTANPNVHIKNAYNETPTGLFADHVTARVKDQIRRLVMRIDFASLITTIAQNDAARLQKLLDEAQFAALNEPMEFPDKRILTLLDYAIETTRTSTSCPSLLLARGATPSPFSLEIVTLIAKSGHISPQIARELIDKLVASGADASKLQNEGFLGLAKPLPLRILETFHIGPNAQFADCDRLIDEAAQSSEGLNMLVPHAQEGPVGLLYLASRMHCPAGVDALLRRQCNPNVPGPGGNTPLHAAAMCGNVHAVHMLLACNANPTALNVQGAPPGHVFDANVDPGVRMQIQGMLAQAAQVLQQASEAQAVAQYFDSLPQRVPIRGPQPLTKTHTALMALLPSAQRTYIGAKDVVKAVLEAALNEIAEFEPQGNPVMRSLVQKTKQAVLKHSFDHLHAVNPLEIPAPDILPPQLNPFMLWDHQKMHSANEFFTPLTIRSWDLPPTIATAVEGCLNATMNVDPSTRANAIFQEVDRQCSGHIAQAVCQNQDRIVCTFVGKMLDFVRAEYLNAADVLAPNGLVEIARSPQVKLLATQLAAPVCDQWMQQLAAVWGNRPDPMPDVAKVAADAAANTKDAPIQKISNVANAARNAIQKYVADRFDAAVKRVQIDISFAVAADFVQECVQSASAQLMGDFSNPPPPGRLWGHGQDEILSPEALSDMSLAAYFFEPGMFIDKCATAQAPKVPPENRARYDAIMRHICTNIPPRPQDVTPAALDAHVKLIFDGPIRDLHLNMAWSSMAAFARLQELQSEVMSRNVVLVEADTGSGKSVLIPQFLAHTLRQKVIVTQPRREAALSIGSHVYNMFGKDKVGYAVGGEKNPNPTGQIQYFTDAFFLGRALSNPQALKDSIVVIDEVHERSSAMDFLYLTLLAHLEKYPGTFRIVLASATVEKSWFEGTCRKFQGCQFGHFQVKVPRVFKVTDVFVGQKHAAIANNAFPDPKNATKRAKLAAEDALEIIKSDPNTKVIVFMPHKRELEEANTEFRMISGGQIESYAIHATALNVKKKVDTGRVFFSNNVLETSFTVKGLTHVLDFNHSMSVHVDPELNTHELKISACTQSSQMQRRGRLGRLCDGEYRHYYDTAQLPKSHPVSLDTCPNDTALQYEARARHYLTRSLFSGVAGFPVLGDGFNPRPSHVMAMVPKGAAELNVAATLSLSGGLANAFLHAVKTKSSAPLAILWLSAILESRASFTEIGHALPTSYATKGLGQHGDHGVLLEIVKDYFDHKDRYGKKFDVKKWCAPQHINHWFLENVDSRLADVDTMCNNVLGSAWGQLGGHSPAAWPNRLSWKWEDIENALLAGYWRNVCKLVDSPPSNGFSKDLHGPYRTLDHNQLPALSIMSGSAWAAGTPNALSDYVVVHSFETIMGRTFIRLISGVDKGRFNAISKHEKVQQSYGFVRSTWKVLQAGGGGTYANANITTAAPWSQYIQREYRWGSNVKNLFQEIVVTGTRVEVAETMDQIASDYEQGKKAAAVGPSANHTFNRPKYSATLAQVMSINSAVGNRLKACTEKRTTADLKKDIHSGNDTKCSMAMANVLLNDFGCTIKGGFVRDIIVMGTGKFKDYDLLMPRTVTHASCDQTIADWTKKWQQDYGVSFTPLKKRSPMDPTTGTPTPDGIVWHFSTHPMNIEFEYVVPHCTFYYDATNMDFTSGNLQIQPGPPALHQVVGIGVRVEEICKQLLCSPPQTCPLYDVQWIPGGSVGTEGIRKNKTCEGVGKSNMNQRVTKHRSKGYWLVEFLGTLAKMPDSNQPQTLYHGTGAAAAQAIVSSQSFRPSSGGMLGAGIYMSRDLTICYMFMKSGGNILQATVHPKNLTRVKKWDTSGGNWANYDSCILLEEDSQRSPPLEEWVIRDTKNISGIKVYV